VKNTSGNAVWATGPFFTILDDTGLHFPILLVFRDGHNIHARFGIVCITVESRNITKIQLFRSKNLPRVFSSLLFTTHYFTTQKLVLFV
jgi:hypothetical protein